MDYLVAANLVFLCSLWGAYIWFEENCDEDDK